MTRRRSSGGGAAADTSRDATAVLAIVCSRSMPAPSPSLPAAALAVGRPDDGARAARPRAVPRLLGAGARDELAVAAAGSDRHLARRRHVRHRRVRGAAAASSSDLHADGSAVVCYISAGSWERWRPDADRFPERVLGRSNGWPGERWLDIRRRGVLRPIMEARLDMCARKGFDAVEFDNVDGYANRTGFPLTGADQLRYNVFLANAGASPRAERAAEERPRPDPHAAAVLRRRAQRAVPPVRRVRPPRCVRRRRQGGVRGRVQARDDGVLPRRERPRLQLPEEAVRPAARGAGACR